MTIGRNLPSENGPLHNPSFLNSSSHPLGYCPWLNFYSYKPIVALESTFKPITSKVAAEVE